MEHISKSIKRVLENIKPNQYYVCEHCKKLDKYLNIIGYEVLYEIEQLDKTGSFFKRKKTTKVFNTEQEAIEFNESLIVD